MLRNPLSRINSCLLNNSNAFKAPRSFTPAPLSFSLLSLLSRPFASAPKSKAAAGGSSRVKQSGPAIKAVGMKKYTDLRSKSKINPLDTYNIVVTLTANNTFIVLTSPISEIILATSAGCNGYKGSAKSTYMATITTASRIASRAKNLGVKNLNIYFKGFTKNRRAVLKGIEDIGGFAILRLEDRTPIPFNGCRPRKLKRK
jgi:small subunit ribosomal protein S11